MKKIKNKKVIDFFSYINHLHPTSYEKYMIFFNIESRHVIIIGATKRCANARGLSCDIVILSYVGGLPRPQGLKIKIKSEVILK
jgi:hypothetical protein